MDTIFSAMVWLWFSTPRSGFTHSLSFNNCFFRSGLRKMRCLSQEHWACYSDGDTSWMGCKVHHRVPFTHLQYEHPPTFWKVRGNPCKHGKLQTDSWSKLRIEPGTLELGGSTTTVHAPCIVFINGALWWIHRVKSGLLLSRKIRRCLTLCKRMRQLCCISANQGEVSWLICHNQIQVNSIWTPQP